MKIAVCDDENKIVEEITSFIKKEFPSSEVLTYSDGETLLSSSDEWPEVLLLDIDMPGISGMEVAAALTREKADTLIVFVTAHDELVYDSFKYHPFAFVRKKFLEKELKAVLSDCEKQLVSRNKNFVFQNASKLVTLAQSNILYFEGQANYLAIHTIADEYKMRSTMTAVEKELEDSDFLRIHKGFLVNLEHIRVLKTEELELDNGTVLPIGKSYSETAKKSILRYMRR
ncbi:LytTR family DNA-binding domain-containing protein [Treponema bryantii]|uniref:LytR/AlgR family response regulator transcription factor n=1 Tax=Treponema bryantii TaxID=163 RepID=UPI002B2A5827|nr:DNA-binding response regulator [Treponema bryantii]